MFYICSEGKDADQLCINCSADLCLSFRKSKKLVFLGPSSYINEHHDQLLLLFLYEYHLAPNANILMCKTALR